MEMGCVTWNDKLDAYFDGELPGDEAQALGKHLRECSDCAADGLSRVQLKLAVKTAGKRFVPDAAFRAHIEKMVAPRKPLYSKVWLSLLATAAVVVFAVAFLITGNHNQPQQQLLSELADLHVATLASSNPVDVVSTDRHTVKPWFEGKVPFTFNIPELQNSPFVLVGGKVVYVNRLPGAELLFRIRQHQLSLFIFQDQHQAAPTQSSTAFSFNVVQWTHEGLEYVLVGDVNSQDLDQLSQLLKTAG
jgi:anti-sigma factor RsiW